MQEVKYALKGEAGENLKKLNDPNAELNFQKLLDGKSAVCFFVGFKNTGKSTYLKCMFNFCANTCKGYYVKHLLFVLLTPFPF